MILFNSNFPLLKLQAILDEVMPFREIGTVSAIMRECVYMYICTHTYMYISGVFPRGGENLKVYSSMKSSYSQLKIHFVSKPHPHLNGWPCLIADPIVCATRQMESQKECSPWMKTKLSGKKYQNWRTPSYFTGDSQQISLEWTPVHWESKTHCLFYRTCFSVLLMFLLMINDTFKQHKVEAQKKEKLNERKTLFTPRMPNK